MIGLLTLAVFIGIPFSISGMISVSAGKEWYHFTKKEMSFENKSGEVTIDERGNKVYRFNLKNGSYTLRKLNDLWEVKCSWTTKSKPYLTYYYDPSKEEIVHENYDRKYLTGMYGYISLPKEKIEEALRLTKEKINEKILQMDQDAYQKDADKIKKGNFYWKETYDGAEFKTDKYTVYKWKEYEKTEMFECYWVDRLTYSVSRYKDNGKIENFYIEQDYLKGLEDVEDFARKQEVIWHEMKKVLLQQKEKERRIREVWEGKGSEASKKKWEHFRYELIERVNDCKKFNNLLNEEDNHFVSKKFVQQIKEIDFLIKNNSLSDTSLNAIYKIIENQVKEVETKIRKQEKETVQLPVEIDTD